MILFGVSVSPFVRKTLAFAAEKGITLEVRPVGLGSSDAAFLAASPFRKMPALQDGDFTVPDSTAICAYLEALHPEPSMIPTTAQARARTIWYEEFADTILVGAGGKIFFNRVVMPRFMGQQGDAAAADKAEHEELPPVLAYIESVIPPSGYLVEDRLTLADLAVASPFANLEHAGYKLDAAAYPKTAAYVAAILGRPSFAPLIAQERKLLGG